MNSKNMVSRNPLVTALLFLLFSASVLNSAAKNHVYITNDVAPEMNITIHCKSKDDDLGEHVLGFSASYEFSFTPNIWGTTLFFCSVSWGTTDFHHFVAYDAKKDKCELCYWNIIHTGPCFYVDPGKKYDQCLPWNDN